MVLPTLSATSIQLSVANATGGTGPYTYQWERSLTSGFQPGPVIITLSDGGHGGTFTPGTLTINANGNATPGNVTFTYTGTVNGITNIAGTNNQGLTDPSATSVTLASPDPMVAGSLTFTGTTPTTISINGSASSGGTGIYTYQWQRTTDNNGTAGTFANLSGKTAQNLTDSTVANGHTLYWYRRQDTDSNNSVVFTPAITAALPYDGTASGNGSTATPGTVYHQDYATDVIGDTDAVLNQFIADAQYFRNAFNGSDLTVEEKQYLINQYSHKIEKVKRKVLRAMEILQELNRQIADVNVLPLSRYPSGH